MGAQLLGELSEATGLPGELITEELLGLIQRAGKDANSVTLDELRVILADYVQDILVSAKKSAQDVEETHAAK
jgi:hypothetical protein